MSERDFDAIPVGLLEPDRRAAIRALVVAEAVPAAKRGSRRRWWAIGVPSVVALAAAGTAGAVVFHTPRSSPPSSSVLCYSAPKGGSGHFPGVTMMFGGAPGTQATVADAVEACSQPWRDGVLVAGSSHIGSDIHPLGHKAVPQLTACVRSDGAVAVMPGAATICNATGMSPFKGYTRK